MTMLNMHPGAAARGLRRSILQAASDLLTARARRRSADWVRAWPRLEGLEDRCLLSITFNEFPTTAGSSPYGITAGPDGNLWFAEYSASKIGMIDLAHNNTIHEFTTPTANSGPREITAGPDGNLWFTEFFAGSVNKIGMIDLAHNNTIHEFTTPTANSGPEGIAAGPDGNLWFTEYFAEKIGEINPTTHAIAEFTVPTGSGPWQITAGPDGNLWFTEDSGNIGMIKPNDPTHPIVFPAPSGSRPSGITAGPDGNLWFTDTLAGKIDRFNPTNPAVIYEFTPTPGAYPSRITAGPDGNLWFADYATGEIGMITTAGVPNEYSTTYASSAPYGITAGPDGIWFTDRGTNAIGLATLATSQLVVTQQPPSSLTAGSPFGLTVTAEDSSGNPITSFNGTVTVGLASNPGGAALGGTLSVTASSGVATFSDLSLTKRAIGYTLDVYASGLGGVVSSAITVTPAAPSQLVITQQPSATATAGQPFASQPVVYVEDTYGNLETGDNSTVVTTALAGGAGPLQGTTSVTVAGGVATFTNLADNKAETLTLQFSGGGFTAGPSSAIVVSPAAATKLAITTQPPSSVAVNAGFGFVAAVEDAYGNVVTSASNAVTVALANNPTRANLSGTTKVTANHGLATFTGLSINKVGSGYTLQVSTKGLTSATTNPFNVVSASPSSALAVTNTTGTTDPLLAPLVLDSPDLWDAVRFKKRSRSI